MDYGRGKEGIYMEGIFWYINVKILLTSFGHVTHV